MLLETLENMIYEGLKNGMSFKQIGARIPAMVARKLNITDQQFHAQLEAAAGPNDNSLNAVALRVASKFSPAEQLAISRRK